MNLAELCKGSTADSDSVCLGSNPSSAAKKFDKFRLVEFFYPSRRLGISSPHKVRCISSALRAVSHHALACIFLQLDDIQCFALMICNSFGIDDIHAFGVISPEGLVILTILCYTNVTTRKTD